ncbi:MAG: alginate lyase family protein [Planctomycetes bacterium]|nr:alginate lyase family protein [Planctomycetota bacterium]
MTASRHRIAAVVFVLSTGIAAVAGQSASAPAGQPMTVDQLDSSRLDLSRPRMFITPDEISRAKSRAAADPRDRAIRDRLAAEADKHLALPIERIDESWWQTTKDKRWEETYPEVYLNTGVIPGRYARAAAGLALAWRQTDDARYADRAVALLMNLAPYSFAPEHYDVGMNYSVWSIDVLRAYDLLGGRLDAQQRGRLDAFMTRLAAAVAKNDAYWIANNIGGGINNHLAWHKMMLGLLGLFYDRPDLVDHCLNGPRGLVPLLADGLVDDGLWCESSLVYQFAAIAPMLLLADCQHRMNRHPGLHEITAANGRTLKQSFDAMFNVLAPDGMIPPIGDAYGSRTPLWKVSSYEYGWNLWGDPRYAWLIRRNPEPSSYLLTTALAPADAPAPPIGSILLPEHGYAFLRSHRDGEYWGNREARCAMLTYDRSGVHANADKLSLMLFGLNRMLVSDVEGKATVPHAFSSQIQRELNRGGLSQNTVMIDGADQRCGSEMLDLVEFRDLPDEKRVTAADGRGLLYPGVRQMRTIAMTPDYVLDVFQVDCGQQTRQIDWIVHVMDERATAPPERNPLVAMAEPFELPPTGAYRWLWHPRSVVPDGPIAMEWFDGQDRLALHMPNPDFERVIFCGYPADDQPGSRNVPMMIVRAQAPRATFVAVWLVGDRVSHVDLNALPDHDGRLRYAITAAGRPRQHLVPGF